MSNFQTILSAIFLSIFVFAVLIFANIIKIPGPKTDKIEIQGKVVIWGIFPNKVVNAQIEDISSNNQNLKLSYIQKDASSYQEDLIEAFANGEGPDLFFITPDMIQKNMNFIYKILYKDYPLKQFSDKYINGVDVYTDSEGIIAYPLVVDPIVLFYNKDIISNENMVNPPKTWDELFALNQTLTKKDSSGAINQSMIALGIYNNITNAKEIISTLLMQNGNPIIKREGLVYSSGLDDNSTGLLVSPSEYVIKFFMEFSNPASTSYSWNSILPNSLDMFASSKLSFYLGKTSDLFKIEEINPNLSYNVTEVPQIKDSPIKRTYGEIYALAISKKSANLPASFQVSAEMSTDNSMSILSKGLSLPPVSRALLSDKPKDNAAMYTFFDSAINARSWVDPDKTKTDFIFKELVENILSNSLSVDSAISKANGQIELLIKK